MKITRRLAVAIAASGLAALGLGLPGVTGTAVAHGASRNPLIVVAKGKGSGTTTAAGNQSNNWSGYDQGTVEQGGTTFHSISGQWKVPTASAHTKGQAEYSATWIGIGGGCIDAGCLTTDPTLIQAGTEQDVDASGKASYSAWWEIIPAPSIQATTLAVGPGDTIAASIAEGLPEVWTITLKDLTRGTQFTQTVPYTSSYLTAEWIEETPLILDTTGSPLAALPNLSTVNFDLATVNGKPANLKPSEKIQLVSATGGPLATPSDPDPDTDGFNDCSYASSCAAPASS